jgi:hypothetical protein
MATSLKLRRGTTTAHSTFTGAEGEVTVDTTKDTIVVHDGSTVGGFPLVTENTTQAISGAKTFTNLAYTGTLTGGTGVINIGSGQFVKDSSGNVGIGTSSVESGFRLHVSGNGFFSPSSGTVGKVVVDNVDQRLVLGSYFEPGVGQYSFISSTNNAETGNLPLLFNTGTTERMRIDSSGNVGIGTSSPASLGQLVISKASSGTAILAFESQGSWNSSIKTDTQNLIFSNPAATERMRIDSSGNVGIGTSSPTAKVHASGAGIGFKHTNGSTTVDLYSDGSNGLYEVNGACFVRSTNSNPVILGTNNAERMRIDSSGSVLIGATATGLFFDGKLNVQGNSSFKAVDGSAAVPAFMWNNATTGDNALLNFYTETSATNRGSITYNRTAGLTAYNTTSDQRLKENIVDASSALSKIDSVKIRSFDWKETGNHVDFGVIAQELIEVAPECVTKGQDNEDGTIKNAWSVDTSALVPALVKAIQELKAELDVVKSELNTLKGN